MKQCERLSVNLYNNLKELVPSQCLEVFSDKYCDIEPEFMGFIHHYYHLSRIIPKHFTVIDLGCCYATQSYYFRNHRKYIGVDYASLNRFAMLNTEHVSMPIEEYIQQWQNKNTNQVFAICNYVPINTLELRKTFSNLYVYYPSGGFKINSRGKCIYVG